MIIFKNYFSVLQPNQDQQHGNILTLITLQEHERNNFSLKYKRDPQEKVLGDLGDNMT